MFIGGELGEAVVADALGGGGFAFGGGEGIFESFKFFFKAVVLEVGDFGSGFFVVKEVVMVDELAEFFDAFPVTRGHGF